MVTTTLRISRSLYQQIINSAEKERRSINREIQYIIERYIEMNQWYFKK